MSSDPRMNMPGPEAFATFWQDMFARMTPPTAAGVPPMQPEFIDRWRKAFFDAMTKSMDDYMRSEAFLQSMKQSMDQALSWQKMMNEHLQKGLSAAQMPSREDSDHVVRLLHGIEDRILQRLEKLEQRLDKVEKKG